jgi:acyl-CoA dehydrogenase
VSLTVDRDQAFLDGIGQVARDVAAMHAEAVDREARFPEETIAALREQRALSAFVPSDLGGGGVSFQALAAACQQLGRQCGASAMVFAMHQIQVVTIVRHLDGSPWFADYLSRLADQQRLIGSVTSEVGTGGDLGRSVAAITPAEGSESFTLEKQAPTVSYGEHADDLFITARRAPEAEPSDQVIALVRRDQSSLERTGTWDPLGMRGTCSPGFLVRARLPGEQVLATPFPKVSAQSMVPVSHLLWSQIWLGIATDAFERARAYARALARQRPGEPSSAAQRLSHVMSELSLLRAEVSSALHDFMQLSESPDREGLETMAAALRFNNLKIAASEQAPRICQGAMSVCGIVGYKNDTPYSIGRHLRDAMSACLMVANERIHQTNASLLLIAKEV